MKLTADDYVKAVQRIERASGWKYQTQKYVINRLTEISELKKSVDSENYKPGVPNEFVLYEQGRKRLIKSLPIQDVVLQHALVDKILHPALLSHLIHDNGAGLPGKGISFTRRRFEQQLHWFYRRHRWNGYVLILDFRKYFDNIDHAVLLNMLNKRICNEHIIKLLGEIFDGYNIDISFAPEMEYKVFNSLEYQDVPKNLLTGEKYLHKSLGIGAPISQILGIYYPTPIDTWCKTVKSIHCYNAYMDDRIIIHQDKEFLKQLLKEITIIADELGIHINRRKTQIVKLSHGFTWLKTRYILTPSGKIIKKVPRDVIVRQRRKMKKLAKAGRYSVLEEQYKSWRGSKKNYNAAHTLRNLDMLYKELMQHGRKRKKTGNSCKPD
ncbi:reverse transcriptase domain-containing protein [Mitsuokella sp.]|uniref:RNA-directed DNA polymerase n=1 Tax=Mitsuokella sp. TaxID=2049034 RepID=UPI003D7DA707